MGEKKEMDDEAGGGHSGKEKEQKTREQRLHQQIFNYRGMQPQAAIKQDPSFSQPQKRSKNVKNNGKITYIFFRMHKNTQNPLRIPQIHPLVAYIHGCKRRFWPVFKQSKVFNANRGAVCTIWHSFGKSTKKRTCISLHNFARVCVGPLIKLKPTPQQHPKMTRSSKKKLLENNTRKKKKGGGRKWLKKKLVKTIPKNAELKTAFGPRPTD